MVRITVDLIARCTTQRRRKDENDESFLKRLTHVNFSDKKLDRIEGLEECVNLVCLYLYENRISRIERLDFALNLTHLYIQDNNIQVMENLAPLRNLRKLFIGGNAIQVIQGLDTCNQLQELHVQAQRLPSNQPLAFDPASIFAIADSLFVLNTQKNNLSDATQFAALHQLEKLDLSMNHIAQFEQVGAVFQDGACMNMTVLEMKGNPVDKQHKFRDYVVLMSPSLTILDGREITQTERQFLVNREAAKARARRHNDDLEPPRLSQYGPPQGVQGQLLMESSDHDPVEERRRARMHIDAVGHKGVSAPAEREVYTGDGKPGADRGADKEKLQQHMQFNGDVPVPAPRQERVEEGGEGAADGFSRVAAEIEERREFLEDMRAAGRGGEYDAVIKSQIAEKVRELEVFDDKISDEAATLANPDGPNEGE